MYNIGNTVNFKSPDGVIQLDITLSDLIDISEGKGDLYSPIEFTYMDMVRLELPEDKEAKTILLKVLSQRFVDSKKGIHLHELQDIYKALTGKHLILK